jgi:hypothetical protein
MMHRAATGQAAHTGGARPEQKAAIASRPCSPVRRANHGSAPVLRPRSLGGFPSSVQCQQILPVARDQFRIAVATPSAMQSAPGSPVRESGRTASGVAVALRP